MQKPAFILRIKAILVTAATIFLVPAAQAGMFNLVKFVEPDHWSLGLEPELTLGEDSGAGINLKTLSHLSDWTNLGITLGTGGGPRQFRVGTSLVFDAFPDVNEQPGIGIAAQIFYYKLREKGQLEVSAVPYIHKRFKSGEHEIEPFFGIPIGWAFHPEHTKMFSSLQVGSLFHQTQNLSFVFEMGVNVSNYFTTVSGGVAYYH